MIGRTVIVIAHRLSTVRTANCILVMKGGRIVEKGSHEELLNVGGEYRRLYDIQFKDTE
jgi:ATP-binding cassette subfamily C protein